MYGDWVGNDSKHVDMRDRWMEPGDITSVPRLYSNDNVQVVSTSTRFLQKSDYLSLNNVRLGYNVPKEFLTKLGISGINLWVSGDNLFLLSSRTGYIPTTSLTGETDRYTYQPVSNYTLGARIIF